MIIAGSNQLSTVVSFDNIQDGLSLYNRITLYSGQVVFSCGVMSFEKVAYECKGL